MVQRIILMLCLVWLLTFPALSNSSSFDKVTIESGDVFTGEILTQVFELRTPDHKLHHFKTSDIKAVHFRSKRFQFKIGFHDLDVITLRDGTEFSGFVQNCMVHFEMKDEPDYPLSLRRDDIKSIIFQE